MRASLPRRLTGFSLVELMVAVAIVGILAAVAYPMYTSFVQRSRRADAIAALTAIVQAQERYRSNRSAYASSFDELNRDVKEVDPAKIAPYYSFTLVGVGEPASFVSGYEAQASAKSDGPQAKDSDCATLSMHFETATLSYLATDKTGADSKRLCWPR